MNFGWAPLPAENSAAAQKRRQNSDGKTTTEQHGTAQNSTEKPSKAKAQQMHSKSNEVKQVLVEAGHQRPKNCEELGPRPKTEHACHYKSLEISFGHWKKICSPNIEAAKCYTNYSTYSFPVIKLYESIKQKAYWYVLNKSNADKRNIVG